MQINACAILSDCNFKAVVAETLRIHSAVNAGLSHEIDETALQDACAYASENIRGAAALDDDVVDPRLVEQLTKQ